MRLSLEKYDNPLDLSSEKCWFYPNLSLEKCKKSLDLSLEKCWFYSKLSLEKCDKKNCKKNQKKVT